MAEEVNLICTACPQGCTLTAVIENGEVIEVRGYNCKKGLDYGVAEMTDPRRMVATTVKVNNGFHPLLPVYTERPVPKPLIPQILDEIRKVEVTAPVKMKSVIVENVLGTGVNVLASRDMPAKQ
jgi:CxxC motif-containing protein